MHLQWIRRGWAGCSIVGAAALLLAVQTARAQYQALERIAFQFGEQDQGQGQNGSGNPIVGSWHQVQQGQAGGTIHSFWVYNANGTWSMSSVTEGGPPNVNGMRMQFSGRYSIKPAGNGSFVVQTQTMHKAPMQLCMPSVGCRSTGAIPGPQQAYYQFRGDAFQSSDGVTAQRGEVPPTVAAPLPAVWNLQPPPPLPSISAGGGTAGRSGYNPPKYTVPGTNGTCDNLQQQRICTINDGYMYTGRDGCQHCSK